MRAARPSQSGFTLLELVVTIAVVSILAAIALPSFLRESRKSKASAEVQPLFSDLRLRLEQYLQENGRYPATIGESTMHPGTAPSTTKQPLNDLPAEWQALKVRISGDDTVYCAYTWATGAAGDDDNIGPRAAAAPFNFTPPSTEWYYLLAKCDMDGDGVSGWYFASSVNPTIVPADEGE